MSTTKQTTCSIRGCDRLASGAPDSDGDLCGDHRAAEHALGRRPTSRATNPNASHDICPNCGGKKGIEDNGCGPRSHDYTLLHPACGHQWMPNEE